MMDRVWLLFCTTLQHFAIVAFLGGVFTSCAVLQTHSCHDALRLSDINSDQLLNRYPEYLIYLNQLSQSNAGHIGFEALPKSLQDTYRAFANEEGSINITDAYRAPSQKDRLDEFCQQAQLVIATHSGSLKQGDMAVSQVALDLLPRSLNGRNLAEECSALVDFSDVDQSGSLNKQEYVILVNLLADTSLAGNFEELPSSLKTTYDNLAFSGHEIWLDKNSKRKWNVFQRSQSRNESTICTEIRADITLVNSLSNSDHKTNLCTQMYGPLVDLDQKGSLSAEEYSTFVREIARAPSAGTFLDLPEAVQNIFFAQIARERTSPDVILNGDDDTSMTDHKLDVSIAGICARTSQIVNAMRVEQLPKQQPATSHQAPPQDDNSSTSLLSEYMQRQSTSTSACNENPQQYNVNLDVQIIFPNDEFAACDSQEQENSINSNIEAALNEKFSTTVADWQGKATFGTFVFDSSQEVNTVDPFGGLRLLAGLAESRDPRNLQTESCPPRGTVECSSPKFCRWGCVTASTTNCGNPPSTTESWSKLSNDVRARLATLGFDCLGLADQLQVVLNVDAPEGNQPTQPPGGPTSSPGANPTSDPIAGTTVAPQVNTTTEPKPNTTADPQVDSPTVPVQGNETISPLSNNTSSPTLDTTTPPASNTTSPTEGNTTTPPVVNNTMPPQGNTTVPPQSNTTFPPGLNATTPPLNETESPQENTTLAPTENTTSMPTSTPTNETLLNTTSAPSISPPITSAPSATQSPIETVTPTATPQVNTLAPVYTPQPSLLPTTATPTTTTPTTTPPTTLPPTTAPIAPTPAPTNTTPPIPTPPPGPSETVEVYDSWIMSNPVGETAADLMADTAAFNGIKAAYASFTDDIIAQMQATRQARMRLRRRRLALSKEPGSSSVNRLDDSKCPASFPVTDRCVTAFGSVKIAVSDEKTAIVAVEYEDTSQLAIDADQLQQHLNKEDPGSIWIIEGSSSPVKPEDVVPNPPTDAPSQDRGGSDLIIGLVISGSIGVFLAAVICLFVVIPACRNNRDLEKAKKDALEALREAEAKHKAAIRKKEEKKAKEDEGGDFPSGPPWPKKDHDEGHNPFREEVQDLIQRHCPTLLDEVDSLLHQYQGREEELVAILKDFKSNESVLDDDSEVEIELDSISLESESQSIASVDDHVPITEIQVAETPLPEEDVAQNLNVEEENEQVQVVVEEVAETALNGIFIFPRSAHGLEPPDDYRVERRDYKTLDPPDDESIGESGKLEPQDESQSKLEPEDDLAKEQERLEQERIEQERLEHERLEQERLEQERLEQERLEHERTEQERLEQERLEQERLEQERTEQERLEQERLEQERREQELMEQEQQEQERQEQERLEQVRLEQVRLEQERLEQERLEQERLEQERLEKERQKQKRLEAERLEREGLEAEKLEKERLVTPDDTDSETWLSSESSEGNRIKWFQKNGCWHSETVPIEPGDIMEGAGAEYHSEEEEEEGAAIGKWVNNGKGWTKESVENAQGQGGGKNMYYVSSDDESFNSSESDEDDAPGPTWVRKNGQWQPLQRS